MIQYNEFMRGISYVEKLGFSSSDPTYIPQEYLNNEIFIIFRTCHSFGDWVIISAIPKLLKTKYPDCTVVIPSPECLKKYFPDNRWVNKFDNPYNNVIEVFANNPYVDGMIDEIPPRTPIFHDHFRIYDPNNSEIPLAQQMLKFWRFEDHEIQDCQPELYWTEEEKCIGDKIIKDLFGNKEYGFLYVDDLFWYHINLDQDKLNYKRSLIQKEIDKHNLPWIYYSGSDKFIYDTKNENVNVKDLNVTLRVQNYIKSKSKVLIGHQGGYGTDCMPRYTKCYVVPLCAGYIGTVAEHTLIGTTYLK